MNTRILELKKVAATIQRTILSLARESFDVNGHEVQICYLRVQGSIVAYVDKEPVSEVDPVYGSKLVAGDICRVCGVTDISILRNIIARVELAMGS